MTEQVGNRVASHRKAIARRLKGSRVLLGWIGGLIVSLAGFLVALGELHRLGELVGCSPQVTYRFVNAQSNRYVQGADLTEPIQFANQGSWLHAKVRINNLKITKNDSEDILLVQKEPDLYLEPDSIGNIHIAAKAPELESTTLGTVAFTLTAEVYAKCASSLRGFIKIGEAKRKLEVWGRDPTFIPFSPKSFDAISSDRSIAQQSDSSKVLIEGAVFVGKPATRGLRCSAKVDGERFRSFFGFHFAKSASSPAYQGIEVQQGGRLISWETRSIDAFGKPELDFLVDARPTLANAPSIEDSLRVECTNRVD